MATINEMRQVATQIENETQVGGNTAQRVGGLFNDVVDKLESDETALAGKQDNLTFDNIPTSGSANPVKSGGVFDAIDAVNTVAIDAQTKANSVLDKFQSPINIRSGYINSMSGYCKSSTIATSTYHKLFLYYCEAGKTYRFTKIDAPENSTRLVFTIASEADFVVGGSVASVIMYGSTANGSKDWTPDVDTYVVCELYRTSPTETYISEVIVYDEYSFADYEKKSDYDVLPIPNSTKAAQSGGIYNMINALSNTMNERTQINETSYFADVAFQFNKFYNTHNKTIGSSYPTLTNTTNDSYAGRVPTKKGHTYTVASRSASSTDHGRPVVFTENGVIVAMATSNNALNTPITYTMQNDGYLYLNCNALYTDSFYIIDSVSIVDYIKDFDVEKVFPTLFFPKRVYGVVGETSQFFYRGIVRKWNPYEIFLSIKAAGFKQTPRYAQVTPSSVGSTTVTLCTIDDDYDSSPTVTSTLIRKSVPASASAMNVLCLGASTTINAGSFPVELKRRLCDSGGTPTGLGFSNISFVGRKTVKSSNVHCEATGGWTWGKFVSAGVQEIRFYLTNADTGYIGAIYSFVSDSGTVQIRLEEWNVTAGDGNALFEYVSSSNAGKYPTTQSGTLTYVSGAEEPAPNLSFTDYEIEAANPFWNGNEGRLDIKMYADNYCNGQIDVLIASLNPFNSGILGNQSVASVVVQMQTFIDALHTDFPNAKVIIHSSNPPSKYYGVEYNYGGTSDRMTWSTLFGKFKWAAAVDEFCNSDAYSSFCYLADVMCEMDSEYAFPTEQRAVDTRISGTTETIGTNGVHPSATGCKMEADAIYRCFICNILN